LVRPTCNNSTSAPAALLRPTDQLLLCDRGLLLLWPRLRLLDGMMEARLLLLVLL
jgi:hypothetical protein